MSFHTKLSISFREQEVLLVGIQQIARSIAHRYHTCDPFKIARNRHIKILYAPLGKVIGFHSYSLRLHVIHLNQELDEPMLQFVCAHELGHTILHPDINTAFMTHRTFFSASKLEREANTFAVELLLPDDFVRENEGCSIYQLARLRGVPEGLVELKGIA